MGAPVQIGEYRTPNSLGTDAQAAGDFVIHNALVVGTDVYLSWYSDGIRVLNAANPRAPQEVAFFVPPSANTLDLENADVLLVLLDAFRVLIARFGVAIVVSPSAK